MCVWPCNLIQLEACELSNNSACFLLRSLSEHHCSAQNPHSRQGSLLKWLFYQFLMSIEWAYRELGRLHIQCIEMVDLQYQLIRDWRVSIAHDAVMTQYKAHRVDCSPCKRNLLFSANNLQQTMGMIIVQDVLYISWFMKKADRKVTLFYLSHAFGMVKCSCDMLTWVSSCSNQFH